MATIQTNRASFQRINPHLRVGKQKGPVLTTTEQANIRKAVTALQKACDATDHSTAMVNLSTAFGLVRTVILDNK